MGIRKLLYMVLFGLLMPVRTAYAQHNMFVVDSDGDVDAVSVSSVDYATFNIGNKWLTITNDGIESAKNTSITASCTVGLAAGSGVKGLSIRPEVGVCYSKDNATPTVDDACVSLGKELKSYTFSLSSLVSGTTYYYRVYVRLCDDVFYGEVGQTKTLGTKPNDKTINGHKFVDLGLPSGLLWAETNIGAETATDDGNYYAWGETKPQSTNIYSWGSYKYYITSSSIFTKYNGTDQKTVLDKEDDAAYVNWGTSCRMPTSDEFSELCNEDNCTWTWISMTASDGSSVKGYKVTSKKKGNSIFFPTSGYRSNGVLEEEVDYWSSTLYSDDNNNAYYLQNKVLRSAQRCYGLTIRPVAEP